jgi:hypothetical protein
MEGIPMELTKILNMINKKLAGELLIYSELEVHLDSVIDDINTRLNACFPVFSEFNNEDYEHYPDYNFFPDKYIRTVVIPGAAYKFYITDEEGISTATKYEQEYLTNLFYMERDYLPLLPEEYKASQDQGHIPMPDETQTRGLWIHNGFLE